MKANTLLLTFGILLHLFVTGCDNSIRPTEEESAGYSIYGKLDLFADSSFIRVNDLNTALLSEETQEFDGQVYLENLSSGNTEELDYRRVSFDDVFVYNFFTTSNIQGGAEYRIFVNREGITESEVEVRAPEPASASVSQASSGGCNDLVSVRLDPVAQGEFLSVRLGFELSNTIFWHDLPAGTQDRTDRIYELSFIPQAALDERFLNNPDREFERRVVCGDLSTQEVLFEFTHFNEGFENDRSEGFLTGGEYAELIAQYTQSFPIAISNN